MRGPPPGAQAALQDVSAKSDIRALAGRAPPGLRVEDFLRRKEVVLRIPDHRVRPEDTLIRGEFFHRELRKGLFLHRTNAFEEHAFSVTSSQEAGLSCIFFLEGEVAARFGDHQFDMGGGEHRVMSATAVLKTRAEHFQRTTRVPQYVRHLVVSATPEWLDLEGFEEVCAKRLNTRAFQQHLLSLSWTPSARLAALVQEAFNPALFMPELLNLYLEGRSVEIIAETLAVMLKAGRDQVRAQGSCRHDRIRLARAREWIAHHLDQPLTVTSIAQAAGASASGLQRLFQRVEGQSVFEYIRRLRLEQAHEALRVGRLSVQEAAALAGYTNAANFATAFKRRYGQTPSEAGRRTSRRP